MSLQSPIRSCDPIILNPTTKLDQFSEITPISVCTRNFEVYGSIKTGHLENEYHAENRLCQS